MNMTSFEVVTRTGQPIRTFEDRNAAVRYAASVADTYPGLTVERVQRVETRTTIWTESRLQLVRAS